VIVSPRLAIVALTTVLATASAARAQSFPHTPVEVGASIGGVGSWFTGLFVGGDVRVTVPVNEVGDVEVLAGVPTAATRHGGVAGFYGVQFRQRIRRATATLQPFATYGGMGLFISSPHASVLPPFIGVVGGGVEQRLGRRLAVRVEAQGVVAFVIPAGIRVAAGVSMPIGPVRP